MRLDKYLKVSRVIKRRSVANEACDTGHVSVNGKVAKPSTDVKEGDVVTVRFGANETTFRILSISEHAAKADAASMYEMVTK
ncbi:MAG: RNA-binding S4 domain-containing protein [Clostridia bacterium]|nr:RNA-binding S4 domain-containing protein [Clostridia bacterium]